MASTKSKRTRPTNPKTARKIDSDGMLRAITKAAKAVNDGEAATYNETRDGWVRALQNIMRKFKLNSTEELRVALLQKGALDHYQESVDRLARLSAANLRYELDRRRVRVG